MTQSASLITVVVMLFLPKVVLRIGLRCASGRRRNGQAEPPGSRGIRLGSAPRRTGSAYENGSLVADASGWALHRRGRLFRGAGPDRAPAPRRAGSRYTDAVA